MDNTYAAYQQGKVQAYPPAQHLNETWDIWGCSPGLFGYAPRATRWFELHRWEPGQQWFSPEYCQFLRSFKGPVYTGGPVEEVANCVVYPLIDVEAEFSSFFLNSSLSLMAALAILEIEQIRAARKAFQAGNPQAAAMLPKFVDPSELGKPDDEDVIGFWGVDMSASEEYARQKPGCWFFAFEILRRGISLYYPPESDLFCPEPVYGISEWDHAYIKQTARAREINARVTHNQEQMQNLHNQMMADRGALDDLNYQIKTWQSPWRLPAGVVLKHVPGSGLGVNTRGVAVSAPVIPVNKPVDSGAIEYTGAVQATPTAAPDKPK